MGKRVSAMDCLVCMLSAHACMPVHRAVPGMQAGCTKPGTGVAPSTPHQNVIKQVEGLRGRLQERHHDGELQGGRGGGAGLFVPVFG